MSAERPACARDVLVLAHDDVREEAARHFDEKRVCLVPPIATTNQPGD